MAPPKRTATPPTNCDSFTLWRHVTANSMFCLRASGDESKFHILCEINLNGKFHAAWPHKQLVPGPEQRQIQGNDICIFTPQITVFSAPAKPIRVEAWTEDPDGNRTNACSWQFDNPIGSPYQLTISVTTQ